MCAIVEDYANKVAAEREKKAVEKANRKAIINGIRGGILTKENINIMYPQLEVSDIDKLYIAAQKPARKKAANV